MIVAVLIVAFSPVETICLIFGAVADGQVRQELDGVSTSATTLVCWMS